MTLDDRFAELVREALTPMLAEHLELLEDRLVDRLSNLAASQVEPTATQPLLTLEDVAGVLQVAPRTVQRMVAVESFPAPIQISPQRQRWRLADVDAWLERGGRCG